MEKKFLLFLLYETLIGIRERSSENGDKITFRLSDLLHNVPLQLNSEIDSQSAYEDLIRKVGHHGMEEWLNIRKKSFYIRYPEYKDKLEK